MVQDQYWFCLLIHVFSRPDLQTELDQLLIKSYISLIHCMTILHLKEQKHVLLLSIKLLMYLNLTTAFKLIIL